MTRPEPVKEIRLQPGDAAVMNLPEGTVVHVVFPDGTTRDYRGYADELPDDLDCGPQPLVACVWDRAFGAACFCVYLGLHGIRNGHHRRDRAVWHEAARMIRNGGVAYVEHEQQDWYGKPVWVAVRIREENQIP